MVLVEGGKFTMGIDDGKPNEGPAHEVTVAAFYMDVHEATVAEYRRCVGARKCPPAGEGEFCNGLRDDREKHPINCIDKGSAEAFCAFSGKRLPTEEEWERAARGKDGRRFPWGDAAPNQDVLCWKRLEERLGTCEVGTKTGGASPFGVEDMAGNVFEWTSSKHCSYKEPSCETEEFVGRGGSWDYTNPANVTATSRAGAPASHRRDLLGVRCVKPAS
jgi:formylglycine-generating enzyme required for sulfatase activity